MPDFAGQAIGFYLQIADQATPGLDKATKSYLALAKAMESTSKTATTSSGKSAQGMALLAGAMEAVDENTKSSVGSINDFVKAYKTVQKIKPAKAAALASSAGGGGGGAGGTRDVRMKAVYPTGQRDAHFDRSSLLGAYKNMTLPPDYVMKMPFMAEGGVVTSPTVTMVGEAGPEAIIPLDKIEPMLQDLVTKSSAWGAVGIKKKARDNLEQYIGEVRDGSMVMEKRWEALYKIQDLLNSQYFTIRKAAQNMNQGQRLVSDQLGITANATRLYQVAIEKASEENDDFTSSGISVLQVLSNVKGAIMDALTASGAWTAALGAASFALAMSMESDLFTVRQQMTMTDVEFNRFKAVGISAMSDFGLTVEETVGIMKTAAFNKLSGEQMEGFVKNVALGTQALEGMGATSESVADLVWNGFNRIGITGRSATRVLSGMAAAAQLGNIEFEQLAGYVKDNADLFLLIKARGGDASRAMIEMSAVAAELGNQWIDAGASIQFMQDVIDLDKWGDMSGQLGAIARATGIGASKLKSMAEAGKLAEVAGARAAAAFVVDDYTLYNQPQRLMELYGMEREEILKLRATYDSAADAQKGMADAARAAMASAKDAKALNDSWAAFNKTLGLMIDRIKYIVLPVLYELGEPMLEIVSFALAPLVAGMRFLMDIFSLIPKPVKLVISALLGYKMAIIAVAAVQSILAIPSLQGLITTMWASIPSMNAMTASAWATLPALKAMARSMYTALLPIIKFIIIGAAIALVLYGIYKAVDALLAPMGGFKKIWEELQEGFEMFSKVFWAVVAPVWKELKSAFSFLSDALGEVFTEMSKAMGITDIAGGSLNGLSDVFMYLGIVVGAVAEVLIKAFTAIVLGVAFMFKYLAPVIGWFAGKLFGPLVGMFKGFLKMLDGDFLGGLGDIAWGMVKLFTAPLRMLGDVVWGAVSGLGGLIWKAGKAIFDAITWPFRAAWESISELFSAKGLLGGVKDAIFTALKGLLNMTLVWSVNSMIAALNAALNYVPFLGNNTIKYRMAAFAEGGIVTGPTMGLLGEAGKEAVIPLDDARAVGEFAAATNLAIQGRGGAASPQVSLQQKKTEDLLTQIRDVLIKMSGGPGRTARTGRGLVESKMSAWEM